MKKSIYCMDCKVKMKYTGETLFLVGNPPKHIYKCPQCGDKIFSKELFTEKEIESD